MSAADRCRGTSVFDVRYAVNGSDLAFGDVLDRNNLFLFAFVNFDHAVHAPLLCELIWENGHERFVGFFDSQMIRPGKNGATRTGRLRRLDKEIDSQVVCRESVAL